jgi:hypothetical protein
MDKDQSSASFQKVWGDMLDSLLGNSRGTSAILERRSTICCVDAKKKLPTHHYPIAIS